MAKRNRTFFCSRCVVAAVRRADMDSPNMYECPKCHDVFYANICHNCHAVVNGQYCQRCRACEWGICKECGACDPNCPTLYAECIPDCDDDTERFLEAESHEQALAFQEMLAEQQENLREGLDYASYCLSDDEWLD